MPLLDYVTNLTGVRVLVSGTRLLERYNTHAQNITGIKTFLRNCADVYFTSNVALFRQKPCIVAAVDSLVLTGERKSGSAVVGRRSS